MLQQIKREDIPSKCPECGAGLKSYHGAGGVTRLICIEKCKGHSEVVMINHAAEAKGDSDAILLYKNATEPMSDKPEKIWYRTCPADCGADYCDMIEDKQRTDDSTEYTRSDLANQIPRPSEVYDRIQGYIRVIQEKDALLADLAKPSEWVSVDQVKLLISLVPGWATIVPKGLDPTFYGTCSYEGDMEIKAKIEEIIELPPSPPNKK